jgi:multimeric flavodoxin WrbA
MQAIETFKEKLRGKKKVLFLTTSNRWEGDKEVPKSTQLAYHLADELGNVEVLEIPKLKIYNCEGNVSTFKGNSCGLKAANLKDEEKNPSGCHRCWASVNNPDDELWKVSKALLESEAVVFFVSVRWGQANAFYQKLIERLTWLENRWATLGEDNIVENVEAGIVVIGQNWNDQVVMQTQKNVLTMYGFKVPEELSLFWQYTTDINDESKKSYKEAPYAFQEAFGMLLKGLKRLGKDATKYVNRFSDFFPVKNNKK